MPTLGGITFTQPAPVGTFPVHVEFGFTTILDYRIITHTMLGSGDLKRSQRYKQGTGMRQWQIKREMDQVEHDLLQSFWESHNGAEIPFTFNAPNEILGGSLFDTFTTAFANEPLVEDRVPGQLYLITVNLVQVNSGPGPTYATSNILERFPDSVLNNALLDQAQELIKLVTIRPKLAGYPPVYLSDRLCTIDGITYQPRLLRWEGIGQAAIGMPNVGSESDDVTLVFGNADRVMRMLADDVQLDFADITISFFHVNTAILVNFWSGEVVTGGWQSNVGPEFTIHASDHLSSPFLICPPRIIDRRCNKFYDGPNGECPFSAVGALDLTNFPNASAASCDHGLTTDNGCYAHTMQLYYAGLVANPQSIRTLDNSTGIFGFFRNAITAASSINDAAYGHPIPIVVTDIPFPVAALIIAGRDEGDFFRALGVVGEGPLTIDELSTLDRQLSHGYPDPTIGIRFITGLDPIPSGAQGQNAFELFPYDNPNQLIFSAGTAGLELLIKDPAGIQVKALIEHTMEAVIDFGWQGYCWGGPGQRTAGPVQFNPFSTISIGGGTGALSAMTNPVWLTVNLYLLCLQLWNAPAAVQETYLDIPAIVAAAAICDLQVDRTVELDQGQETQWKFIGVLQDQKPLRDWMADVLLNAIGIYSFRNGKLSISVRENGASVVAYTDGNMIFRSLHVDALGPKFTRLTATFADREYAYVANTATFQDDDYAEELGRGTRVLHHNAQMNLSGTADISPATRFVITRGREEIGGITAAERKAGRMVTWRTTALGFDTSPGDVASITNVEMPGGTGKVRVERWKLLDDWQIELTGRTVTDSMYDLVQGPKPADIRPGDIPGAGQGHRGPVWRPNRVLAQVGDPVFDLYDRTFASTQQTSIIPRGATQATLLIEGANPVNSPIIFSPKILRVTQSSTGGNLRGGHSYFFTICAQQGTMPLGNVFPSAPAIVVAIQIPANTNTNSVTLDGILWPHDPPNAPWDGYTVFGAIDDEGGICEQFEVVDVLANFPTSILITGLAVTGPPTPPNPPDTELHFATYSPPVIGIDHIRIRAKFGAVFGVTNGIATQVTSIPNLGSGTLRCMHLASDVAQDTDPTEGGVLWRANSDPAKLATDDWSPGGGRPQRILSVMTHKATGTSPLLNFLITAYDSLSGTFTLSPDPVAAGVSKGDIFVVRIVPTWQINFQNFFDPGFDNGQYALVPAAGIDYTNCVCRIIWGPGRGQTRPIVFNDKTGFLFDKPMFGVDVTSVPIIEFPTWVRQVDYNQIDNSNYNTLGQFQFPISDMLEQGLVVQAIPVMKDGKESTDFYAITRDLFVFSDSFGIGGKTLGARIEFGRGDNGGGVPVNVGDISAIIAAQHGGFLQGWDIVNQGPVAPVGDSTFDLLRYDPNTLTYVSILGGNFITIPAGSMDKVIFSSAFLAGLNLAVTVGPVPDLFMVKCLTVGSTPPVSPVVNLYWGDPLPTSILTRGLGI